MKDQLYAVIKRGKLVSISTEAEVLNTVEMTNNDKAIFAHHGYFIALGNQPDVFAIRRVGINGKRYPTLQKAIADNPVLDAVLLFTGDIHTPNKGAFSVPPPFREIEKFRITYVEKLQAEIATEAAKLEVKRQRMQMFDAALSKDMKPEGSK